MQKVAIFVEGPTETKFIKKLIAHRYGHSKYRLSESVCRNWEYFSLEPIGNSADLTCHFQIVEVPSYDKLFSYVIDSAPGLVHRRGFHLIIGLRDLHPNKRNDKAAIVRANEKLLATKRERDRIALILAVMQTEAWFLCDHSVFQKISGSLTNTRIRNQLGFDLVNEDPEMYDVPATVLKKILGLSGLPYRKRASDINMVVSNIDFDYLLSCITKIDSFFRFLAVMDRCGLSRA